MFLRKLRDRFVGRVLRECKEPSEAKKSTHFQASHSTSPIRDVLSPGRENPASGYEATPVWNTRDSMFWGWRRATEYFRALFETDYTKEVYELMAG